MTAAASRLLETARRGELHHAIILHGPSRESLRALALSIAKTLECLNGSMGDDCPACARIDRRVHPDVHFVGVPDEKTRISVDQVRDIVGEATLRPYEGRNKVFILESAEMMNLSAANALLKTLEEPARNTMFLLLARSPDLLPITIRSRSQAIFIAPAISMPSRELAKQSSISIQSARLRQASSFVDQRGDLEALTRAMLDQIHRYATARETAALLALAVMTADREDVAESIAILSMLLRDIAALDFGDSIAPEKFSAIQQAISRRALLDAAESLLDAATKLAVNADPRLMVEQAVLRMTEVQSSRFKVQ